MARKGFRANELRRRMRGQLGPRGGVESRPVAATLAAFDALAAQVPEDATWAAVGPPAGRACAERQPAMDRPDRGGRGRSVALERRSGSSPGKTGQVVCFWGGQVVIGAAQVVESGCTRDYLPNGGPAGVGGFFEKDFLPHVRPFVELSGVPGCSSSAGVSRGSLAKTGRQVGDAPFLAWPRPSIRSGNLTTSGFRCVRSVRGLHLPSASPLPEEAPPRAGRGRGHSGCGGGRGGLPAHPGGILAQALRARNLTRRTTCQIAGVQKGLVRSDTSFYVSDCARGTAPRISPGTITTSGPPHYHEAPGGITTRPF